MKRLLAFLTILSLILLSSCELAFEKQNPAPKVGTVRILVYGNDYGHNKNLPDSKVAKKLNYTINDAAQTGLALSELAKKANLNYQATYLLGDNSYYANYVSSKDPSATVINKVTQDELEKQLNLLKVNSTDDDLVFIFYAGHGFGVEGQTIEYGSDVTNKSYMILTSDSDSNAAVYYPIKTFMEMVELIAGTKMVIGDFCFSGALLTPAGGVSITSYEYRMLSAKNLYYNYKDKITEKSSIFCLSACRYNERSYETGSFYHGLFTKALLEGLGWNEDECCLNSTIPALKNGCIKLSAITEYVIENDGND
ncbi:MAG: caspase family protein, partial [Sphaerochaetaceae bacterium]|nr:caspase family protein [Sphaerochaetaceae bacterium]